MHDTVQTPRSSGLRARGVIVLTTPVALSSKILRQVAINSRSLRAHMAMLLALLSCCAGCLTMHQNHYFASSLPTQLVAAPNQNPQLIDFTKLSSGVGDSDKIGPEDLLQVTLAANLNTRDILSFPTRVNREGQCNLPLIGSIQLSGVSLEEAEAIVTETAIQRGLYRAPHVTVTMKKKNTIEVMVIGAVREEGKKIIPATENDLLSILFHAGGLSNDAGPIVQINNILTPEEARQDAIAGTSADGVNQVGYTRPRTPKSAEINLISAATKSSGSQYFVGDGGVVMVQKVDPKAIYVSGLVRKSGKYDYPVNQDLNLIDAVSLAGWTSSQVADKVNIIRQSPDHSGPVVIQASLLKARHDPDHNLRLAPGDQIVVEHTAATVVLEALNMVRIGVSGSLNPLF